MKEPFKQAFNSLLVVLLTAYVFTAFGYNEQARMLPLIIGIPVWLLALWQWLSDLWADIRTTLKAREGSTMAGGETRQGLQRTIQEFLWVVGAFASIYLLGFLATSFLYTLLYLRVRSGHNWRLSLGIPLGALAFIYVVMISALQVQLYEGVITLTLRRLIYGY